MDSRRILAGSAKLSSRIWSRIECGPRAWIENMQGTAFMLFRGQLAFVARSARAAFGMYRRSPRQTAGAAAECNLFLQSEH
jgi:hypothetical protein